MSAFSSTMPESCLAVRYVPPADSMKRLALIVGFLAMASWPAVAKDDPVELLTDAWQLVAPKGPDRYEGQTLQDGVGPGP
jgi:hypothetical protein